MGMGFGKARHLLARAGFGGTPAEIDAMASRSLDAGVTQLIRGARRKPSVKPPTWVDENVPSVDEREMMTRKSRRQLSRARAVELRAWWYKEMIRTPSPLTERMVLLWHNHFTSSVRKVKWVPFIYRQNALLRRRALGNFADLLLEITRDPAMLLYLDNQSNHKREPNENFARELLELFTLGEGHYTEKDIKAAARAFTGWRMRRRTGEFRFVKADHDKGNKTFLGKTGAWKGDDIVAILLKQPRTAELVTEKIWREFISDSPDKAEVTRLAGILRKHDYQMAPLLKAVMTSPAFNDKANRGGIIKSPVDLLVGTVRVFDIKIEDTAVLGKVGQRLGQDLFSPPNVKGWPGGPRWISSHTLLARHDVLMRVARRGLKARKVELGDWLGSRGLSRDKAIAKATRVLLPMKPVNPIAGASKDAQILGQMVLDPTYQLK